MKEEALIKGCIKRDASCQKQLFLLYSRKMMTVCLRYARNRADAEDILQDGFIRLYQHIHQFKFAGSFEGWMRRIFVNAALKKYQTKRSEKEQIGIEFHPEERVQPDAINALSEQELLQLISQLPEGYRIVFNMYVIEGYSHKEIGALLQINEATSRTQLLKARKYLQNKLAELSVTHGS